MKAMKHKNRYSKATGIQSRIITSTTKNLCWSSAKDDNLRDCGDRDAGGSIGDRDKNMRYDFDFDFEKTRKNQPYTYKQNRSFADPLLLYNTTIYFYFQIIVRGLEAFRDCNHCKRNANRDEIESIIAIDMETY